MVRGTIGDLGENRMIERLRRLIPSRADVLAGIGDDCAVVRTGRREPFDLLLKSDPVIEGVHFTAAADPVAVGHKAVGRVLSDIAAMGGEPLWAVIDLVAPPGASVARIERIYRGAVRLAKRWGLAIVGGDTARGRALELHVMAVGRVPRGAAVLRAGASNGDVIYVTGALGGSAAGRHLTFTPRLAEGQWLAQGRWATAMMDISDGLAADLPRLLVASGRGAVIETDAIPVSAATRRLRDRRPLLDHALGDGEDFELLFTVPSRRATAFEAAWRKRFRTRCSRIGAITTAKGLRMVTEQDEIRRLTIKGYEHFGAGVSG